MPFQPELLRTPAVIETIMSATTKPMPTRNNASYKTTCKSKRRSKRSRKTPTTPSRPPYQSHFREEFDLVTARYPNGDIGHERNERLKACPPISFGSLWKCAASKISGAVSCATKRLASKRQPPSTDKEPLLLRRRDSEYKYQDKELPPLPVYRQDSGVDVPESPDSGEYHTTFWYLSQNKYSDYQEEYHTADWHLRGGRHAREWENDAYDPTWQEWEGKGWMTPIHLNRSDSTLTVSDSPTQSTFTDPCTQSDSWSSLEHPQPMRVQRIPLLERKWDVMSESVYSRDTNGQKVEEKHCRLDNHSDPAIGQVIQLAERNVDWLSDEGSEQSSGPFMTPGVPIVDQDADCRFCGPGDEKYCPLLFSGDDQACLARFAHDWVDPYAEPIDQSLFANFDGAYAVSSTSEDSTMDDTATEATTPEVLDNTSRLRALAAQWLEGEENEDGRDSLTFQAIQAELGLPPPPPIHPKSSARKRETSTPMQTPIYDEFVATGTANAHTPSTCLISDYLRPWGTDVAAFKRESWIPSYAYLSGSIN